METFIRIIVVIKDHVVGCGGGRVCDGYFMGDLVLCERNVGGGILADGVVDFFHKRGDVLVIAAGYADLS